MEPLHWHRGVFRDVLLVVVNGTSAKNNYTVLGSCQNRPMLYHKKTGGVPLPRFWFLTAVTGARAVEN